MRCGGTSRPTSVMITVPGRKPRKKRARRFALRRTHGTSRRNLRTHRRVLGRQLDQEREVS